MSNELDQRNRLKIAADIAIARLLADIKGLKAVVVSTEDGFEVSAYTENTAQTSRLAAMASSLTALCNIAGEESKLGDCDHLIISAQNGHILMIQVPNQQTNMILSVIAGQDAIIGQAIYFLRVAARALQAPLG